MGCFSDREKGPPSEEAKWTYITLSDFRCTSAWTMVAYVWLWFLALIGVAVYVVDTYTAVNLLAFNHWSSKVQPKLAFQYSKWIFAGCILFSWALCIYEWIRAMRVIKRGGVAESFLDPLAVNVQSMRSKGWKRFLVFSELTKSKKGADYVALFVYFSFKTAIRVILAEGPRQVVNALTLYAVMDAQLLPGSTHEDDGTKRNNFDQFWFNVQTLADEDKQQAVVYFSMLFTLCIWVFSALSLIISFVLYILFLWHYIPSSDGRLSVFCKRKIDKRLAKIVEHKVNLGIREEQRKAEKAERKAELQRQKTGDMTPPVQAALKKQPTLPDIGGTSSMDKEKQLPDFPLSRQDTNATMATLPPYSARPPTRDDQRQPTLPRIATSQHPGMPVRSGTQNSAWSAAPSYSTEAPLLANAGHAGGYAEDVPLPTSALVRQDSDSSFQQYPEQPEWRNPYVSRKAYTPGPGSRAQTPMFAGAYVPSEFGRPPPAPRLPLPVRSNTATGFNQENRGVTNDSAFKGAFNPPLDTPVRSNTATGFGHDSHGITNGPPLQGSFNVPFNQPVRSNTADDFRPEAHARQGSNGSQSLRSQRSFSRPMPARTGTPVAPGYGRSYAPVHSTVPEIERTPTPESYELQPQPTRSVLPAQPSGPYIAFNPSMQSRTATVSPPLSEGPQRNVTVTGASTTSTGDHFQPSVPQRSLTAPVQADVRHSNYAQDILAEYGASDDGLSRGPSPGPAVVRSATAEPHGSQWQGR